MAYKQAFNPVTGKFDLVNKILTARTPIAVGIIGQSTERGQVDIPEKIYGVSSATQYPQAFRSLRKSSALGGFTTLGPALAATGCNWFKMIDDLWDYGYDVSVVNGAIGSSSFVNDIVGFIYDRTNASSTNNKLTRAQRSPIGPGDLGFQGEMAIIGGKLFRCTVGAQAYAMNAGSSIPGDTSNNSDLDYLRIIGTQATGATPPDASGISAVGQTLTDGAITWTCLSLTTVYQGFTYTAGSFLNESRTGFDPYYMMHRVHAQMQQVRDSRLKIIILENGQSDTASSAASYSLYLQQAAAYFLKRGYVVMIGLTFYWPASETPAGMITKYNNLSTGVDSAYTASQTLLSTNPQYSGKIYPGANLYQLLGTTGNMGGATFSGYVTAGTGFLTVSALSNGLIEVGQQITSNTVITGSVRITGQLSGTAGGAGTYSTNTTTAFGSSGAPLVIISAGGYFAKDYPTGGTILQDSLHPNAAGAIAGGAAWANAIKAWLPQLATATT